MTGFAATLTVLSLGWALAGPGIEKRVPETKVEDDTPARVTGGATLTAWGKVGGRKWSVCAERSAEAERALRSFSDSPRRQAQHAWTGRARACPNSIEVLSVAARKEAVQHFDLPDDVNKDTDFSEMRKELGESQARAAEWLLAARTEAERQGKVPPSQSAYWLARVELARSDYDAAARYLKEARLEAAISEAELDQLEALVALFRGDMGHALAHARLGLRNAPLNDKAGARFIYALVLDRVGDDEGADRLFVQARSSGSTEAEMMDTLLPLHERLYFRARLRMAQRGYDERGAISFFRAYLEQPEVGEAQRALARAHIERLSRIPGRLGG